MKAGAKSCPVAHEQNVQPKPHWHFQAVERDSVPSLDPTSCHPAQVPCLDVVAHLKLIWAIQIHPKNLRHGIPSWADLWSRGSCVLTPNVACSGIWYTYCIDNNSNTQKSSLKTRALATRAHQHQHFHEPWLLPGCISWHWVHTCWIPRPHRSQSCCRSWSLKWCPRKNVMYWANSFRGPHKFWEGIFLHINKVLFHQSTHTHLEKENDETLRLYSYIQLWLFISSAHLKSQSSSQPTTYHSVQGNLCNFFRTLCMFHIFLPLHFPGWRHSKTVLSQTFSQGADSWTRPVGHCRQWHKSNLPHSWDSRYTWPREASALKMAGGLGGIIDGFHGLVVSRFLWRCFSFLGERDSNWDSNENIHPLYTNYKCVFLRHTRDPSMTCMPSFINHGHYRFSYPEILKNLKLITCVEGTLNQPSQTAALLYGWNNGNESENCVIAWSCIKCQGSKPFKIRAAWL